MHVVAREVEAERPRAPRTSGPSRAFTAFHNPERVFELFHQKNQGVFFNRKRTASTDTAATIEEAPASSPKGGRRKRAIITYARTASKAYRPATFAAVNTGQRRGDAPVCGAAGDRWSAAVACAVRAAPGVPASTPAPIRIMR